MKNLILLFVMSLFAGQAFAQTANPKIANANVRFSFLLFPFSPLLTVEFRTFGNVTLQVESNFVNTHGANLKYFINQRMDEHYVFAGTAFVENKLLRKDLKTTILPYTGYGYTYRFGKTNAWIFDSRLGIGATTYADNKGIYPVIKTGIGRTF
jgi:hypothetical protein